MYLDKNSIFLLTNSIYRLYFFIFYFFLNSYRKVFPRDPIFPINIDKVVIDPIKKYIDSKKERFISSNFNENTDKIFYSKKDYQELLENPDNYLEKKWKHNILFENTPRGNIIMYYDAFKQGFTYYCDSSSLSYEILNAVAMKYVYTFRCQDFFIDQNIRQCGVDSPFINIYINEENEKKDIKQESNKFEGAPFAKFKNYNTVENKIINKDEPQPLNKIRNKFINLGKICNFKITQPIKKINKLDGFHSKLLETFSGENQLQKDVLNYKNYKLARIKVIEQ